jgi:hypothetical protein
MWQESLNVFLQHYQPTKSAASATDSYSTEEIAQSLERHTGSNVSRKELYEELLNRSYIFDVVNGNEFHLLMINAGTLLVLSDGRT